MLEQAVSPSIGPQLSRHELVDHINRALETADIAEICRSIGTVARLFNISDLAGGSVYRAFAGQSKHPNFKTVLSVLDARRRSGRRGARGRHDGRDYPAHSLPRTPRVRSVGH
jgi:hypothetical protein